MALCLENNSGTLSVSITQTETNCTSYLLMSADEYRLGRGFFSGVAMDDVIETSGLVVLCWAVAWSIKNWRRAI